MLFSSIPFLYYFLPIVFLVYFAVPKSFKNFVILVASLFFYGCGEPKYLILMSVSILIGYGGGLLTGHAQKKGTKRVFLTLSVVLLAGLLAISNTPTFLSPTSTRLPDFLCRFYA